MAIRHFLTLSDLSSEELRTVVIRASTLKKMPGRKHRPFVGRTLAMIFTKNSTRTRVSFESGMARFGGHALFLHSGVTQLGRDEPLADTARVLSSMCDVISIRNDSQADQIELARHSAVPVINALSDLHHPCQLLADMQTWFEHRGDPRGKIAAWVGDGNNNVCHSWIEAAQRFGFTLRIACPPGFDPRSEIIEANAAHVSLTRDARQAVDGAHLVVTDTWTSMGQEEEQQRRIAAFKPYQVDQALMAAAHPQALFQHCLPAHRGEEVTAQVIDGPQSVVWDEAENRMWAQLALLEFLLDAA